MAQLGTKKSRKGCERCKRRRVKCDEHSPICGNCQRRGEQCSLQFPASPSGGSNDDPVGVDTEDWLQDLELMHHYTQKTSRDQLGSGQRIQRLWQQLIPTEAARHPFLMHGILALAALHAAYTRPIEAAKYMRLFDRHQASALALYRTKILSITEEAANALFALATTLSVSSMANSVVRIVNMPEPRFISMEAVAEAFMLTRGVREVTAAAGQYIVKGPFAIMLWGYSKPDDAEVIVPESVKRQFASVHNMLRENCNNQQLTVCAEALEHLLDIYEGVIYFLSINNVESGQIWRWTALLTPEYIRLVQACFKPALVVLAHFAAVMGLLKSLWYIQEWSRWVMEGIHIALGFDLQLYIIWPQDQLADSMSALRGRQANPGEFPTPSTGATPT